MGFTDWEHNLSGGPRVARIPLGVPEVAIFGDFLGARVTELKV